MDANSVFIRCVIAVLGDQLNHAQTQNADTMKSGRTGQLGPSCDIFPVTAQ
jgi:hypothetical protein